MVSPLHWHFLLLGRHSIHPTVSIWLTGCLQVLEQGNGSLGWDIEKRKATIYDSGNQNFDTTTIPQLVRAIASVLHHPIETTNQYIFVNSFTLTQNLMLSTLERLQDTKYTTNADEAEAIAARGEDELSRGDYESGYPDIVTGCTYTPWHYSHFKRALVAKWKITLGIDEAEDVEAVFLKVLQNKGLAKYYRIRG
jgi:hypothetical protein